MDKLEDPTVAYAYVSFDHDFTLFKIYTAMLRSPEGDVGRFEAEFKCYWPQVEQSSDPVGWIKRAVREYVAICTGSTGIQKENWIIEFSPLVAKFPVPSHLFLSRRDDVEWLG